MRRPNRWHLALAAWLLGAAAALLAGEAVPWQPTFEAALAAARDGQSLAMAVLVAPSQDEQGRDLCALFRERTLADGAVAALVRERFAPVLFDLAVLQQQKKPLPKAVQAALKQPIVVPSVLVFDAGGKLVGRIEGYAEAGQFLRQLQKIAGVEPVAPQPAGGERVERGGKSADDYEDLRTAMDALESALGGMAGGTPPAAPPDGPEAAAARKLEEGGSFERLGKLGFAIRAYGECLRDYPKSEAARKAKLRLEALRDSPEIKKQFRDYQAKKLLDQATLAIKRGETAAASKALDTLLESYADTQHAAAARKLRDQLAADPNAARRVQDDQARKDAERLLSLARSYQLNKMPEKAIAQYRAIVEKYPNTSFADAARQAIKELAAAH